MTKALNGEEDRKGMGGLSDEDLKIARKISAHMDQTTFIRLKELFSNNLSINQEELSLEEFKKLVPAKKMFFVKRIFNIFDTDRNGRISIIEFFKTIISFESDDADTKIAFLFKVFDTDDDGYLQDYDLRAVIEACIQENGMKFNETELEKLSNAIFQDGRKEGFDHLTLEDFKNQLSRREGLVENLSSMIVGWMVPKEKEKEKSDETMIVEELYTENMSFLDTFASSKTLWINFIILVNLAIFGDRIYYFRHFYMADMRSYNPMYQLSRAFGKALLWNSVLILVLVCRKSITALGRYGFAKILPLEINIYLHKIVGILIFCLAFLHSLMHCINFYMNIQPDPIKLVQLSYKYWKELYGPGLNSTGYSLPPGCYLVDATNISYVKFCPPGSLDLPDNINLDVVYNNGDFMCQACPPPAQPWTYAEFMLTSRPTLFGSIGGIANPTGLALMFIMFIMFICSLPFIRRTGHFEVFYYTHLLYWLYFALLLFHAPKAWMWIGVFLAIWLAEQVFRLLAYMTMQNKTVISAGVLLPSNTTGLIIKRPSNFTFKAGDYIFVNVPEIASGEWHPFTISSAPEVKGHLTLHIRAVGEWTKKLRNYFVKECERQKSLKRKDDKEKKQQWMSEIKTTAVEASCTVNFDDSEDVEEVVVEKKSSVIKKNSEETLLRKPIQIFIDGPFGSPSANYFRAEHAVFIGTGIGITPFASILQSIMHRQEELNHTCPKCEHNFTKGQVSMGRLNKVDFFWINRDQTSFEWFIDLMSQLEAEQASHAHIQRFLDINMYFTAALKRTDMKAVVLQLALDMLYEKEHRDLLTGLRSRTHMGRPDWDRVFSKIRAEKKGKVTVFYCGNPALARTLRFKCQEFGFKFSKEVF